jgi:hypothetical protein
MDDTGWHLTQCSRNGKYEEEGKHWCRQHSPSATKARQKASDQRYEAISRRNSEKWAEQRERDRRAECFPDLVAALEPFAKYSADYRRSWPNTPAEGYVTHFETMTEIFGIRLRDLDRAAAALAKVKGE